MLFLELACWQVMVNHHRLYLEGTLSATSPLAMRPTIMTSPTITKGVAYLNRNQWFRQTHTHNCVLLFIYTTWNVRQKKFTQIKMSYSFKFVEEVYHPPTPRIFSPGEIDDGLSQAVSQGNPETLLTPGCERRFDMLFSCCSRLKHSAMRISTARLEYTA